MRLRISLILATLLISCIIIAHTRLLPLNLYSGKNYTVQFSKGIWVHLMANPKYENINLVRVENNFAWFSSSTNTFFIENSPSVIKANLSSSNPPFTNEILLHNEINKEIGIKVSEISALYKWGIRVWGNAKAQPIL